MKNLRTVVLLVLFVAACTQGDESHPGYVRISGKITNPLTTQGQISAGKYKKTFAIREDGTFSDTFHLPAGGYAEFSDGNEVSRMYLENGYDLHLTLNTDSFDESIRYTGIGAPSNNYLAKKFLLEEQMIEEGMMDLDSTAFAAKVDKVMDTLNRFLAAAKDIDPDLRRLEEKENEESKAAAFEQYRNMRDFKAKIAALAGKPAPQFTNYENYAGGTTSLSDLKGKYVFMDIWATWCAPCRAEIPFMKKLMEQFGDKNIAFVSISIDKKKDHDAWRQMVKEKEMKGIQLFADKDWDSDFIRAFHVEFIPRFILIGPDQKVIDAMMPKPSDPRTAEKLSSIKN